MRTFHIFDLKLKSRMAENRSQLGFTLIEVMVVIAIIGIMATLIVPQIMSKPDEARVIAAKQDISSLVQALKLYRLDIGRYPTTEQGLSALVESRPVSPFRKTGNQTATSTVYLKIHGGLPINMSIQAPEPKSRSLA